jgi:hypothetical protein
MARIRTIKPTFWTDDKVTSVCRDARLLFVGIWNFAGDDGLIEDKPRQIKMQVFPGDDDLSADDVARLIDVLVAEGLLDRYDAPDSTVHLHVHHWVRHQRVDRPSKGVYSLSDLRIRRGLASPREDSLPSLATEGKGREGKGENSLRSFSPAEAAAPPPRADVERVCRHLADQIESNGCRRPEITQGWRDSARLLIDKDGRSVEQILTAINWATRDDFWRANILSMPTLRKKYDQLRLAAQRSNGRPATTTTRVGDALSRAAQYAEQERAAIEAGEASTTAIGAS